MAAWGDTSEKDESSKEQEAIAAPMAKSELDSDFESFKSLSQVKDKVRGLSKAKIEELLLTLMDECDAINAKNYMVKDVCTELKKDVRLLEKNKHKLKHLEWDAYNWKLEIEEKILTLCQELDQLKDFMNIKEKEFSQLESESLDLKRRLDSLVSENNELR